MKLLFLLFTFTVVFSFDPDNEYCLVNTCPIGLHTMCLYPEDRSSHICGIKIGSHLSKIEEEISLLTAHNYYRMRVFEGNEVRGLSGGQPRARETVHLEWDNELAEIAQRWSDQCIIANDECRNTDDFYVGQNYILENYDTGMDRHKELAFLQWLVGKWYREVQRFDSENVRNFNKNAAVNSRTLNYTQMVWQNTTKVGCGVNRYTNYEDVKIFLVCNYAPSGNHDGESVYAVA